MPLLLSALAFASDPMEHESQSNPPRESTMTTIESSSSRRVILGPTYVWPSQGDGLNTILNTRPSTYGAMVLVILTQRSYGVPRRGKNSLLWGLLTSQPTLYSHAVRPTWNMPPLSRGTFQFMRGSIAGTTHNLWISHVFWTA